MKTAIGVAKNLLFVLLTPLAALGAIYAISCASPLPARAQTPQRFDVVRQYQVKAIGRTLAILLDAKTGACFIYAEDNDGNYAGAGSLTAASQDVCSEDK